MERKGVLGRGLRSLIPELNTNQPNQEKINIYEISIKDIIPNEFQPREKFDKEKLVELKKSIEEKGLMQPILVRPKNDKYEIIAGERRFRACSELNMDKIPVIIRDVDNKESLELAIIENIQREDLNYIERAKAFKQLIEEFGMTQQELSKQLGMERSSIANNMRLLSLPDKIQDMIEKGQISYGHAKALLSMDNVEEQYILCEQVLSNNLSVRETEKQAKSKAKTNNNKPQSTYIVKIKDDLQQRLGTKVDISYNEKSKKGFFKVEFYSDEDMNRILEFINQKR